MTFRSDDEYWVWLDSQVRRREKLCKTARYVALFAIGIVLVFAVLYFCVRGKGAGRYDPWQQALNNVRLQSG